MSKSIHDLKLGQTLIIGDATIRLEKKSGQQARLVVEAPEAVPVQIHKSAHECISSLREKFIHG